MIVYTLFFLIHAGVFAQSQILPPGETFSNQTADTLYIIPMQQVKSLLSDAVSNEINMQKLELYKNKLSLFEERSALADSAITIKKLEAGYWHGLLLKNDELLEKPEN